MQCNQAFWPNGFTNGPFGSSYSTPYNSSPSMYPEIVGEGQVTSVILPDGSVQFFFMPTLKWWSPNATQCHPFPTTPNPMFANTNYSIPPPCNNNIGTWFIRSISNPYPQNVSNLQSQRNELLRLANNTNYNNNLSSHDFGYQVKFHNDGWTSTTDLVYFYPSLRQCDFVFPPPCKDKIVQKNTEPGTNNTVCNYEVVCTKPCLCSAGARPMSLDCLVDPKLTPKSNNNSTDECCCSKTLNKRGMVHKKKRNKSKNIICHCGPTANTNSADKSITTYADEGCTCTPADGRETQTCNSEGSKCVDAIPMNIIKKSPMKSVLKPRGTTKSNSGCSTTDEGSNHDISKAPYKRDDDKEHGRRKPKKCDCGFDSSANSVSLDETVASKDTLCTCSICNSITLLKKSKQRSKGAAQRTSSEQNTSLQWFKSNNCVCDKYEPKGETREPWVSSSSKIVMEGGFSKDFLQTCSHDCDTVASPYCR